MARTDADHLARTQLLKRLESSVLELRQSGAWTAYLAHAGIRVCPRLM